MALNRDPLGLSGDGYMRRYASMGDYKGGCDFITITDTTAAFTLTNTNSTYCVDNNYVPQQAGVDGLCNIVGFSFDVFSLSGSFSGGTGILLGEMFLAKKSLDSATYAATTAAMKFSTGGSYVEIYNETGLAQQIGTNSYNAYIESFYRDFPLLFENTAVKAGDQVIFSPYITNNTGGTIIFNINYTIYMQRILQ